MASSSPFPNSMQLLTQIVSGVLSSPSTDSTKSEANGLTDSPSSAMQSTPSTTTLPVSGSPYRAREAFFKQNAHPLDYQPCQGDAVIVLRDHPSNPDRKNNRYLAVLRQEIHPDLYLADIYPYTESYSTARQLRLWLRPVHVLQVHQIVRVNREVEPEPATPVTQSDDHRPVPEPLMKDHYNVLPPPVVKGVIYGIDHAKDAPGVFAEAWEKGKEIARIQENGYVMARDDDGVLLLIACDRVTNGAMWGRVKFTHGDSRERWDMNQLCTLALKSVVKAFPVGTRPDVISDYIESYINKKGKLNDSGRTK